MGGRAGADVERTGPVCNGAPIGAIIECDGAFGRGPAVFCPRRLKRPCKQFPGGRNSVGSLAGASRPFLLIDSQN
jgi:hypothetical protein